MAERNADLRDCSTAYECRDRLPELAAWMADEDLKLLPIYRGATLERGVMYFDLDNPRRGPFVADGAGGWIKDHTYVSRGDVPEHIWAKLATWQQPLSEDQAREIDRRASTFGAGRQRSAAGEARPLPR